MSSTEHGTWKIRVRVNVRVDAKQSSNEVNENDSEQKQRGVHRSRSSLTHCFVGNSSEVSNYLERMRIDYWLNWVK
jgi:hypothetical protein